MKILTADILQLCFAYARRLDRHRVDLGKNVDGERPQRFCGSHHGHRRDDIGDCFIYLPPIVLHKFGSSGIQECVKLRQKFHQVLAIIKSVAWLYGMNLPACSLGIDISGLGPQRHTLRYLDLRNPPTHTEVEL
jgi:hypothetical protein